MIGMYNTYKISTHFTKVSKCCSKFFNLSSFIDDAFKNSGNLTIKIHIYYYYLLSKGINPVSANALQECMYIQLLLQVLPINLAKCGAPNIIDGAAGALVGSKCHDKTPCRNSFVCVGILSAIGCSDFK